MKHFPLRLATRSINANNLCRLTAHTAEAILFVLDRSYQCAILGSISPVETCGIRHPYMMTTPVNPIKATIVNRAALIAVPVLWFSPSDVSPKAPESVMLTDGVGELLLVEVVVVEVTVAKLVEIEIGGGL